MRVLCRKHNHNTSICRYCMVSTLLFLLFVSACIDNSSVIYSDFVDIPYDGWRKDEYCEFNTASLDSTLFDNPGTTYNVILTLRHTDEYPYTTISMPAVQSVDSCTALPDTLTLRMTDAAGKWRGLNSKGIYTISDTVIKNTTLPPQYSLRLFHVMPQDNLRGILSVGIIIESNHRP